MTDQETKQLSPGTHPVFAIHVFSPLKDDPRPSSVEIMGIEKANIFGSFLTAIAIIEWGNFAEPMVEIPTEPEQKPILKLPRDFREVYLSKKTNKLDPSEMGSPNAKIKKGSKFLSGNPKGGLE